MTLESVMQNEDSLNVSSSPTTASQLPVNLILNAGSATRPVKYFSLFDRMSPYQSCQLGRRCVLMQERHKERTQLLCIALFDLV
jgi:hypothetical protein